MNASHRGWLAALGLVTASCVVVPVRPAPPPPRPRVEATVTFYETLSPYGEWIVVEDHGRVWRPHVHVVGPGFVPYFTGGQWVHTETGWAFSAQWEWAWLPFHYGRWYEDERLGWLWVPGTVWASAWVEWRYGGGYVGWLPLPPPHRPRPRWCYVESRHFTARDLHHHRAEPAREADWEAATTPVPPPSGHAVFDDEPTWSPGPPVAALRAEAIDVPERAMTRPAPVTADRIFPKNLPPAPAPQPRAPARVEAPVAAPAPVPRPELRPAPAPVPAPLPPPVERRPSRLEPKLERQPTRPFVPPPTPMPPGFRPAPGPQPQPGQPLPPQEDPRKKKKVPAAPMPGQPLGPTPPVRPPPGA